MKRSVGTEPTLRDDEDRAAGARCALVPAERLVFAALKGWAGLRAAGERPHGQIAPLLAHKSSGRVSALFVAWIQAVEANTHRTLRIECPGCGGLAADAQRLIVSLGIAPVDLAMAQALLEPILMDTREVATLGRALNAALAADGWRLPARMADPNAPVMEGQAPAAFDEGPRTLH